MSRFAKLAAILAVFSGSLIVLCWSAGEAGIATGYVDPISKIQAQDEAFYGAISFEMASHGGWLTPRFDGRYALTKPPLLNWFQAALTEFLGRSVWALHLPSLLAGSGTVALVFAWLLLEADGEAGDWTRALAGALIILSSHLFFTLSRIGLTDALLMFWTTLALFVLARHPGLNSTSSMWVFGLASGAALMTKGIAGLFALGALGLFCAISEESPAWPRLLGVTAISLCISAPWHLYQLAVHTRWFWNEYVMNEIVRHGMGSPPQTTDESQLGFYLKRLIFLDAPLLTAALFSLARKRSHVIVAWALAVFAAALIFNYRSASYLLPLFPALAILAAGAVSQARAKWALAAAVALFTGKLLMSAQPWGLPWHPEFLNLSDTMLDRYAALHRRNELIVVEPDDQFYSACLGLPQVRYVYLNSRGPNRMSFDLPYLGIAVTAQQFANLPELLPEFARRLREWRLDTGAPVATAIFAPTGDSIAGMMRRNPNSDFFLPRALIKGDRGGHQSWLIGSARVFLLSRNFPDGLAARVKAISGKAALDF